MEAVNNGNPKDASVASISGTSTSGGKPPKPRRHRACDTCRRKRIRCDGSEELGTPCRNCISFRTECTYNDTAKKSGPNKGYIRALEARIAKLERMLREDGREIPNEDVDLLEWQSRSSSKTGPGHVTPGPSQARDATYPESIADTGTSDYDATSDEEFIQSELVEKLQDLSLNPVHRELLGKSSNMQLVKRALSMKASDADVLASSFTTFRREEFWTAQPWEIILHDQEPPAYVFPEPDLLWTLVAVYFERVNCLAPILHRPTFEAGVREGRHLRDRPFASVMLMVCAVASRQTDDTRVLLEGSNTFRSAGWKWFNQVQMINKSILACPTLYDLQLRCLYGLYLPGSSVPQAAWSAVGQGLQMAQDVGAHKKRFYGNRVTLLAELWKRAFWVLVSLDRGIGGALGRLYSLRDDEIEIDYPLECDDDTWADIEIATPPVQARARPSTVTYFNMILGLGKIYAESVSLLYPKGSVVQHRGLDIPVIMAKIDSAMNGWFNDMPSHLRWTGDPRDPLIFRQSALLNVAYYRDQLLIHRPFISFDSSPSAFALSCTTICISAARSIINIADTYRRKAGCVIPEGLAIVFPGCMVLLLRLAAQNQSGRGLDNESILEIQKGLCVLRIVEERWAFAGILVDMIMGLAAIDNIPLSILTSGPSPGWDGDAPAEEQEASSTPGVIPQHSGSASSSSGVNSGAYGAQPPSLQERGTRLDSNYTGYTHAVDVASLASAPSSSATPTTNVPYPNVGHIADPYHLGVLHPSYRGEVDPSDHAYTSSFSTAHVLGIERHMQSISAMHSMGPGASDQGAHPPGLWQTYANTQFAAPTDASGMTDNALEMLSGMPPALGCDDWTGYMWNTIPGFTQPLTSDTEGSI